MFSDCVWRVQDALHGKNSSAFPGALLMMAGVCIFYRHMTQQEHESDAIRNFLIFVVLQMLPLIVAEMKILSISDPVGLICKFGPKVLLMHACFLFLRVCRGFVDVSKGSWTDCASLAACCAALQIGFQHQWTLKGIIDHADVWFLASVACAGAYVIQQLDSYFRPDWFGDHLLQLTLGSASAYIEILGFVPAVWLMYRMDNSAQTWTKVHNTAKVRRAAVCFFSFLVGLYFFEDVLAAIYMFARDRKLVAAGHILHFILVVDFAGFLLAHIYDPQKLKADILSWFPDARLV